MTENELCDIYIRTMSGLGFTAYPETSGYDIILTRGILTLGVQAKLRSNLMLVEQLMGTDNDVDFKIALTADMPNQNFINILHRLRLLPVCLGENRPVIIYNPKYRKNPLAPFRIKKDYNVYIPDFVPDIPAGVKAPRRVEEWNVLAVKLELMAMTNHGWVSTQQARSIGLKRIPKQYFRFDFKRNLWYIHNSPSKKFPHILKGLLNASK